MNNIIIILISLSLPVLINCGGNKMNNKNLKLQSIKELHKKDKNASLKGDVETLLSLFTEDGIVIPDSGDIVQGKKNLRRMLEQNFKIFKKYKLVEYNHDFKEINIIGEYAYEWGNYNGKYISKTDKKEITGSGKLMRILRLQKDGPWKVSRSILTVNK